VDAHSRFGSLRIAGALVVASIVSSVISFVAPPATVDAAPAVTVACSPSPSGAAPDGAPLASFTVQEPARRLVDTRDGTGGYQGEIGAGCTLHLDAAAAGAPTDASALALSVTAIAVERGYLTVFPCAGGQPATSNVNARPFGTPTPNLAVALVDANGMVCIYSQQRAHLVVDMTGWWTEDGPTRFRSIPPVRADDSRLDPGRAPVPPNTAREIDLSAIVPEGTEAVVANLTVTEPAAEGYLVAFPCGVTPLASNLNFRPGESRAVAITVGVSADRKLCVQSNTSHHVVVDVSGYYEPTPQFGPASALTPVAGTRLADSRTADGPWTASFEAGTVRSLRPVAGRADAAQGTAVVINTVATAARAPGYVTVYPCDGKVPLTSIINFAPGEEATNLTFVDLSATGEICFFTSAGVDLVVDLFGVMTAPTGSLVEHLRFDRDTWPPFSPAATDYVVECGDAPVELELDLLVGTSALVNNVPVRTPTLRLPGADDDLTTVELRRDGVTRKYWFRCVPDDFPRFDVERPGNPNPGWYLTTAGRASTNYAMILDEYGAPVWYKRLDVPGLDLKRRSDGRLVYVPFLGPRYGIDPDAGYRAMSLYGTLVGEYLTADEGGVEHPTDHHDYAELPGGRYALISYPVVHHVDLTALPGTGWLADDSIADNVIQEFDAAGSLVWSWALSDHFGYDEVPYPVRWPAEPAYTGGEVDVWHTNALAAIDDGSRDYLVTARHLDAAFRIDRATGKIDWILGSLPTSAPQKTGAPRLQIIDDPLGGPRRPHHARLRGDVLTIFDNRADTGQPSRAVAYRIDDVAKTATMLWSITAPGGATAFGLGSVDLDTDGSVVVGWGPLQPMVQEFDPNRRLVLQISQVPGGQAYRVIKEPKSTWTVGQLRLAAGGTAEAP
jgi:hypothetical protein